MPILLVLGCINHIYHATISRIIRCSPMIQQESPTATTPPTGLADPFSGEHESQSLIGVANIFLGSLFYDVKLDYQVPIISQQGEV